MAAQAKIVVAVGGSQTFAKSDKKIQPNTSPKKKLKVENQE